MSLQSKLFPGIKRATELILVRGSGTRVWCSEGGEFLDFTSGIGVTSTGHCHPTVVKAVQEQAAVASHLQQSVAYSAKTLELIERLEPYALGLDSFFFANSGGEAVEGALRLARQATGRPGIIAFHGGYHGLDAVSGRSTPYLNGAGRRRTAGALAVTSSSVGYRGKDAGPLPYGSFFAPYPYAFRGVSDSDALDALDMLVKQQVAPTEVAAVLIEPVLGEGGYVPASPAFLQSVRAFCDAHGALLIADEVQCGVGRTGAFYACETSGVVPDVLVTAKGLASGYPLSAVATSTALASTQPAGCMGGTYWRQRRYKHFTDHGCKYRRRYGGNAVACAAAVATLDVFETEDVLENVAARSAQAAAALDELAAASDVVADVRAPGLMIGVEFADVKGLAGAVARECEKRGLLVLPTGVHEAVRLIPPLTVTEEDMADALDVFAASVRAAASAA